MPSEAKIISVLKQTLLRAQLTFGRVDLTQSNEQPAQVESRGTVAFSDESMPMTETTISGIGSITKQFTAATLIKLWDEDLTKSKTSGLAVSEIFPEGIDTKFANFMPALRERFPQSSEQFDRIERNESYSKVTLHDLLSHTHGLGERDNKESLRLLRKTGDRPLELHEIINVTTGYHLDDEGNPDPTKPHKHGDFCYSNFGCDMTAMIIECITNQPFDEVVKEKVLRPHGLNSTYPQSDHIELYASNPDVARGYMIDHNAFRSEEDRITNPADFPELNFNTKSNTRAAGGFKSTVGDLAKFARLYMNAKMFENAEVVETVKDYGRGAEMAKGHPDKYHLAIQSGLIGGAVGHTGDDNDFFSNLRFFPETGEVKAELLVVENITKYVANKIFAKTHPGQKEIIDDFVQVKFRKEFKENNFPEERSEQLNELARSFLNKPDNQPERKIFEEYCAIIERIELIPRQELIANREAIIANSIADMTRPQQALERIATDENFHGIAAISGHDAATNITGVSSKTPFPIHSVGKILSGVLMVEMVTQGIITESDLTVPGIRLQPEIEEKLTRENPAVMERLSQVSILQAMQHTAGLASLNEESGSKDCIDNYTKHLREGGEARRSMGDMVDFVGDKLTEIGKEKYSNDGLLLAGFALQNLYNSRTGQNFSYEEILNKLVIEPSQTNISMTRPLDVHYKAEDAEHLSKYPATPAGGHFASTDDLLKLGEYLYQRCQDQEFMKGVKKYGAEFYDKDRNAIYHGGYMEGTTVEEKGSSTEFAVSLNDGKTIAILMDRDASEDDRNSRRLSQTHARGFYKELRNSLEQENELHKPKIALITPGLSGDTDGSTIEQDAEKLKSLGFRVEFLPGSVSNFHPFVGAKIANTAEQRARQVINFAQDPEVVAMWAVNGGESCPEVAKLLVEYGKDPQKYLEKHRVDCVSGEALEYSAGAENGFPKDRLLPTIVGMSDVSSIQLSLAQFGFPSHYGSVSLANVEYLQRMSEAVQNGTASELEQITQISRQDAPEKMSGTVYATVNGGLESSLHTDWQPKFPPNTVLMIEGVSGYDAIASTLNKAKQAGTLANVSAILVGNPVDPGQGINPESRERFTKFAGEFDLPIFSVGGNQFGHLAGKEPTPIANFGNIEIDTRLGTARIEQGSVRENILQFHAEKVAAPRVKFEAQQLGINPPALELTSINQHPIPTELTDVVGGKGRSLPMHLNLAGKTLLVDYSNWVELGRQMTDIANRGELEGVKAIIFSVDNHYPELKSRFDSATSEQEKVAVGLSFVTHPDFKFSHNSENTYRCDNATKERAEISFIPWLKSRGIELEAKDILVDGEGITLPIPIERNSEIIAQVTNEKSIGFVRQSAGRAEYFAKQHPEIPVFLTDRSNLPEVMRGPLFSVERLEVLQSKMEKEDDGKFAKRFSGDKKAKEFEDIGSDSKKSWVDRISNSNQSRDDSVIKR